MESPSSSSSSSSKPHALQTTVSKLTASANSIPHGKDFHFYNNFDSFKSSILQTDHTSHQLLTRIGAEEQTPFLATYTDMDVEPYDWLVNLNDSILERLDVQIEELKSVRKVEVEVEAKKEVKVKQKIPFHIPTLKKPQDEYRIVVNNKNGAFEHVWMEKSTDGRRVHPLVWLHSHFYVDYGVSVVAMELIFDQLY